MKKSILLSVLCFVFLNGYSQKSGTHASLLELIQIQFPHIDPSDKILSVTVWRPNDEESRSCAKAFEHCYDTFKDARLKGGRKGFISVILVKDRVEANSIALLKKDGIQHAVVYSLADAGDPALYEFKNAVFDSRGELLFKNVLNDSIFNSVQSLITR